MFIYKKLKASDANTIAFEAHKEYNINKDNTASLSVSLLDSSYSSASRDTYSLFDINNHKQYFQLDHLFYKDALFNYGNLIGGIDYNNQEKRLYDKATIISLSQKTFGSGVQKGTFLFNNTYKDDSLGNLYQKNDILSNYPQDKERVFYLAPVKGFKSVDLTRDPNTGEPIVNAATSYNDLKLDDSLYINPVEYISCSFARNTTLNCTEVDLTNGYIKAPNSNNYNFSNEDFTISFYYKVNDASPKSYILAKSKTQTVVEYPESNLNGSLKNTHGSSSLLQPKEVDAGKAFPFEIFVEGRKIHFNRADQNIESTHNSGATSFTGNTLYHVACVKTGSELKIYLDGTLTGGTGTDTTDLCQNKADLFIGTDPTISSSKLDNTSNQSISQLMIWNRGLTATEVTNVSESIDGSPYVGNIFYENGIATLTSPKVNDGTLTSLQDTTGIITLNNTPYVQGPGTEIVLRKPTFSGSLTFTSSLETLEGINVGDFFNNLIFDSTYISASLNSTTISLVSNPYALVDDYIINPIQSESFDEYVNYVELSSIVDAIPGGIGTGSGDRGTDGDSFTITESIGNGAEGIFLAENQTVTESINVLFISNSQDIIADDFTGDSSISDTSFTIPTGLTEYVNTAFSGLYVKAGTPSGVDAWFSGSMAMTSVEDITAANIQQDNIAFDTTTYSVPDGVDTGAQYRQFDGSINAGTIELLNDDFSFNDQPQIHYRITTTGFAGSFGPNYNLKVRIYTGGGTQIHMDQFNSVAAFTGTVEGLVQIAPTPQSMPGVGTKYYITLQYDTDDPLFPNGGSNDAKYNVDAFGLFQPTSPFNNELRLTNSIPTKLSSIYHISCSRINPNQLLSSPNDDLIGLNEADDGNKLGVKTALWKRLNNAGSYSLITQSFYPSGSSVTNNTFEFTHQTSDTDTEDLKFTVVSDTAENIIPSTINNPNTISIKGVPLSSSLGIGTLGGDYVVNETSASNVLHIQNGIENHFTASENISSQIIFNDTSNFVGNTTSPVDILGFQSNNSTKILLDGNYLATSSFAASTASLERGNFISGSASIDITGTKQLYKVDSVTLGTTGLSFYGATQTAIELDQKIRVQTKKDGVLQDTRFIAANVAEQNLFQADADKLDLGLLDNTNNVSFEFTVVDSNDNIAKVNKNQGFNIRRIRLSKLTGSNEVTLVNDESFPTNLDALYFSSSHIDVGNANIPFTTGQVTASIASFSADGKTITLSNDLFITQSLNSALFHVSGAENGPFIISASFPVTTQLVDSNKEYQVIESFLADPASQDPGTNEGLASHLLADNNIISSIFIDPPNTTLSPVTTYRNFPPYDTLDQQYVFFVSGVASPLYPDGAITSSAGIDYTCSFQFIYVLSAISGSNISSGDTFTAEEFAPFTGYESDLLGITSSHNDDPHIPSSPLYTLGKQDIPVVERTSDGHIKVNQTLFITASSKATGSSDSSSITPGDYSFTSLNPIGATGVTPDMLGGTFQFQDLGTLETSEYQITAINGNEITLENQGGGSNAIQTVNISSLNNTPEVTVNFSTIVANEFTIQYKNSHLIFENEFHCTVDEDEYNFSLNPTARKNKDINKGDLANFATGSNFKPYVTTVGLYNEAGELLVVGKLGQPVRMSDETDTTFVVRYDT